jgi:hypothetical protein
MGSKKRRNSPRPITAKVGESRSGLRWLGLLVTTVIGWVLSIRGKGSQLEIDVLWAVVLVYALFLLWTSDRSKRLTRAHRFAFGLAAVALSYPVWWLLARVVSVIPPPERTVAAPGIAAEVNRHSSASKISGAAPTPRGDPIPLRTPPREEAPVPAVSKRPRIDHLAPKSPAPAPQVPKPPQVATPLTLHDLFAEKDFPGLFKSPGATTLTLGDGAEVKCEVQLYWDYMTKAKFIGIYVPYYYTDILEQPYGKKTFAIAEYWATHYGDIFPLVNRYPAGGFVGELTHAEDLTFTGRAYIYHETALTPEQEVALRAIYRKQGIDVQFRSTAYLVLKQEFAAGHK